MNILPMNSHGLTVGPVAYAERPWRRDPSATASDGDIYEDTPGVRARTVRAAFDAGIRLFFAAHEREAVSLGASVRSLGIRDEILLAATDGDALDRCPDTEAGGAAAITAALARKRELLRTNTIDLFLLTEFRPETHTPARLAGAQRALDTARAAGSIRHIGATCEGSYAALAEALGGGLVLDIVCPRFNFFDQRAGERLLPVCRERGIVVLATQPFAWMGGISFVRFPNTWRYRNLTKNFYGFTAGQAHLHWILSNPAVAGVLVSMQTPEQVTENVAAVRIDKTPAGLESLFDSFREAIVGTREGWRALLQDEQWEIRTAAEEYLGRRTRV